MLFPFFFLCLDLCLLRFGSVMLLSCVLFPLFVPPHVDVLVFAVLLMYCEFDYVLCRFRCVLPLVFDVCCYFDYCCFCCCLFGVCLSCLLCLMFVVTLISVVFCLLCSVCVLCRCLFVFGVSCLLGLMFAVLLINVVSVVSCLVSVCLPLVFDGCWWCFFYCCF